MPFEFVANGDDYVLSRIFILDRCARSVYVTGSCGSEKPKRKFRRLEIFVGIGFNYIGDLSFASELGTKEIAIENG